jgi:hypothetical protein
MVPLDLEEGWSESVKNRSDTLKEYTHDKTLENTIKTGINTKLSSFDDKGVYNHEDDVYTTQTLS